jgi:hypothetical protein
MRPSACLEADAEETVSAIAPMRFSFAEALRDAECRCFGSGFELGCHASSWARRRIGWIPRRARIDSRTGLDE